MATDPALEVVPMKRHATQIDYRNYRQVELIFRKTSPIFDEWETPCRYEYHTLNCDQGLGTPACLVVF
ncbi:MAG TPA: hypothetical protein DCM28_03355 [Phycisphaerales bacterium]|nr:hypothetical protein [Phycisphaerales bacterium]HCD34007.1 hypothetical protein [Phycisphaerales bacterium]|tara:strand:+ start:447 stop:650 length:204 start_codon:yes stop_codon:yes gene_type:complete